MLGDLKIKLGLRINPNIIVASAQICLALAILLGHLQFTGTEFLQGLLLGYALVGNLAWLIKQRKDDETN